MALLGDDEFSADWGESFYFYKSIAQNNLHDKQAAIETLSQGIKKYPASTLLYRASIDFYSSNKMDLKALNLFEQAIRNAVSEIADYCSDIYVACLALCWS